MRGWEKGGPLGLNPWPFDNSAQIQFKTVSQLCIFHTHAHTKPCIIPAFTRHPPRYCRASHVPYLQKKIHGKQSSWKQFTEKISMEFSFSYVYYTR